MSVPCDGHQYGKINYLHPEIVGSWPDVVLVASDGSKLMTSRLMLASVSEMFCTLVSKLFFKMNVVLNFLFAFS